LCERLLRKSQLLDTVVLRVGEVVGEERVRWKLIGLQSFLGVAVPTHVLCN
jgi:hypothetical protein